MVDVSTVVLEHHLVEGQMGRLAETEAKVVLMSLKPDNGARIGYIW